MKKFFIVSFLFVSVYINAQTPSIIAGDNNRSWTLRTIIVRLRGLDPAQSYKIEGFNGTFNGDFLMNSGITFPVRGAFKSRIFKLQITE